MDEEDKPSIRDSVDKYRNAIYDARFMLLAGIALAAVCMVVIVAEENRRLRAKKPCNCNEQVADYPVYPTAAAEEHIRQARAHYPDLDIPVEGGLINDSNTGSSDNDKPDVEQ